MTLGDDWCNWSGAVRCPGVRIDRPRNVEALSELVTTFRCSEQDAATLRPIGSGHSFVPFWAPDDRLLAMDAFAGLEGVTDGVARLGAGTPLHAIGPLLASEGLALENMGDIDRQTLAGAVATGTHGTGLGLGSLSSGVVAIELVDGRGKLQQLTRPEAVAAARVALGLLGVMTRIDLAVVPAYGLHETNQVESVEHCLDHLDERLDQYRHHEFWWVPRSDRCVAKTLQAIPLPRDARLDEVPFGESGERWGASWRIFPSSREQKFNEMEYAVPLAAGPACFRAVRERLLQAFPALPWPVEYRVVAGDDGWLSPTAGEAVAAISIHQGAERDPTPLFAEVEPILRAHGGRPHWGKCHDLDAAALDVLYPRRVEFSALRRQLDPEDRFLTAYLARLFG